MKPKQRIKLLITTLICAVFCFNSFSQNASLKKYIAQLDSASSFTEIEKVNAELEKLLSQNKKWQNYYYAAFSNILLAFESKGKDIDVFCKKADEQLIKADSLNKNNSEITVLTAMSAAAKINADAAGRGMKFGSLANKLSDKAISQNPNNPRAYLMKAKSLVNTPAVAGGGYLPAKKNYETSLEKYKAFKSSSDIDPNWGSTMAKKELQECNLKLKTK